MEKRGRAMKDKILIENIVELKIAEYVILTLANAFAECDTIEDAECIFDQIYAEEYLLR
jgi:hypothetical protein